MNKHKDTKEEGEKATVSEKQSPNNENNNNLSSQLRVKVGILERKIENITDRVSA